MTPARHIWTAGRRHQQCPAHKVATAVTDCAVDDAETAKGAIHRWHSLAHAWQWHAVVCDVIAVTSACAQARPCPAPLSLCCAHYAPRPAHGPILPTRPAMHPPCPSAIEQSSATQLLQASSHHHCSMCGNAAAQQQHMLRPAVSSSSPSSAVAPAAQHTHSCTLACLVAHQPPY